MKLIIGIDPGMTGAVAILPEDGHAEVMELFPSADGKRVVLPPYDFDLSGPIKVWIEDINAIPTFGSQTSFKMGRALGALETWADGLPHASIEYVKPAKWKKAFGLILDKESTGPEKKRISLECARRLFPGVDLHRVADHNKAEALLIAEYGRRVGG